MRGKLPIANWIPKQVISVEVNESLEKVRALFKTFLVNQIPVTRDGVLVGVINRKSFQKIRAIHYATVPAKQIMTRQFIFLFPENSFTAAKDILKSNFSNVIPVVDHESYFLGLISKKRLSEMRKKPMTTWRKVKAAFYTF